jgi:tRNA uridine 5-carboxymethylaminomethyl modification enzyme
MGVLADAAGIQFRILNRSRGPAVWGPRAQCDRALYRAKAQERLASTENLALVEGMAEEPARRGRPRGGRRHLRRNADLASSVVVTTGTFLNGLMHTGKRQTPGGRVGEEAARGSLGLSGTAGPEARTFQDGNASTRASGLGGLRRLHAAGGRRSSGSLLVSHAPPTGAPGAVLADGHESARPRADSRAPSRKPDVLGQIHGIGPRYCPSVEDKVVKFADKASHTIFLEPDGWSSEEIYINGLSTSLPEDVQRAILAEIPGLTRAKMIRPGYAVEYDFVFPEQLSSSLAPRDVPGLFLAGQINGTSATRKPRRRGSWRGSTPRSRCAGEDPFVLERHEAYAGVMVDDLTQRGVEEPYRLFTSRAEYRLLLGVDTVLPRLLPHGRRYGLIDEHEYSTAMASEERLRKAERDLDECVFNPTEKNRAPPFGGARNRAGVAG